MPRPHTDWWILRAREVVQNCMSELPSDIRDSLSPVVITCRQAQRGTDEEDLLGLFEGLPHGDGPACEPSEMPRITLFTDCLAETVEQDPQEFDKEVRLTLLHEIGHYLGWDEDEVEQRGL